MRMLALAMLLAAASATAFCEEISFGFRPMPPYVMVDKNGNHSGLEYDIIVAALAVKGHTVKAQDLPLARLIQTLKAKEIKAGAPVLPSHDTGAVMSDSYISYNNVALALKRKNLQIKTVADLKGLGVIAFQTAKAVLGPDFAAAMEGNARYVEDAQQVTQIRTLFAERVDVAIGESRILAYYVADPATKVDRTIAVQEFRIFPPTNYRVGFVDPKLAADFNEGLKAIKADGTYDKIVAKYSK
jgi:polar amino acid transport system substrate-binding protein